MPLHHVDELWHLPSPERQRLAAEAMEGYRPTSLSRTLWVTGALLLMAGLCGDLGVVSSWLKELRYGVSISTLFPCACVLWWIAVYLDHRHQLRRLQVTLFLRGIRPARCFRCRVDLAESPSARCPRCGTPLVRENDARR